MDEPSFWLPTYELNFLSHETNVIVVFVFRNCPIL